MIPISDWYAALGQFSFPTVFIELTQDEIEALVAEEMDSPAAKTVAARIQQAIHALPGSCFVAADVCAPTDSESFGAGPSVSYGRAAWRLLASSEKVRNAFGQGLTRRITVRPYRRMNKTREYRMFFSQRELVAMSQYCLERHFGRLAKRDKEIWRRGQKFAAQIKAFMSRDNVVVDVYYTSDNQVLIVDLNPWGPPTDPLLLKTWERDWETEIGVKLIPKPVKMKGEISVSF
jgi:hypothetical protein